MGDVGLIFAGGLGVIVCVLHLARILPRAIPGTWTPEVLSGRRLRTALFDLGMLVALLEGIRLASFHSQHVKEFEQLMPAALGAHSRASYPEGLEVSVARPGPTEPPELSVNLKLPLEVGLPSWISTAGNLAITFAMRAHVLLDVLPEQPVVRLAAERSMGGAAEETC